MKLVKLETQEQFNNLKKDDLVVARWRDEDLRSYKIYGLINNNTELLLSKKRNHYFIINMYLNGESYCKEAWLATKE